MNIIEWKIDETKDVRGISAISIVEHPAIEMDFMTFSKDVKMQFKENPTERQVMTGPALIPGKQIYRVKDNGEEYYGFFSKDTVRQAMELYMIDGNIKNHTFEHEEIIGGLTLIESWIVEDPENDKAKALGFSVPKGTWMVSIKVNNSMIWDEFVKTGSVKGFSVEGYFVELCKSDNSKSLYDKGLKEMKKSLFEKVKALFEEEPTQLAEAMLADGRKIFTPAESFEVGVEVLVEIDGEQVPLEDGTWELEGGAIITVQGGKIVDPEAEMTEEEMQAELSALIASEVEKATAPLNEKISELTTQLEGLKNEKEAVEKELKTAKAELSKKPAGGVERKPKDPRPTEQEFLNQVPKNSPIKAGVLKNYVKFKSKK